MAMEASLPRLIAREMHRRNSDPSPDTPDLDFEYADSDTYLHELSELYSYSEVPEFDTTRDLFRESLAKYYGSVDWCYLTKSEKMSYIMTLLEYFEVVKPQDRLTAVRQLLYIAHGNYSSEIGEEAMIKNARENVFLLLQTGAYEATIELLSLEMEQGRGMYEGTSSNITIADNYNLRICLSLLYAIVETIRIQKPSDPPEWVELRKTFVDQLSCPVYEDECLTSLLFMMLLGFCNGSMPHYPVKKILLLIWKTVLAMMGGMEELEELKQASRSSFGIAPSFPECHPAMPLVLPTAAYDPRGQQENDLASASASNIMESSLHSTSSSSSSSPSTTKVKVLEFRPKARKKDVESYVEACRTKFGCFGTGAAVNSSDASQNDLIGLPEPIQESIRVLREHIYIPLADVQVEMEEKLGKAASLSLGAFRGPPVELPKRDTATEKLYRILLPNLPQYMIALLKVLLAAAPTSRTRNDSLNILVDVLPPEPPSNLAESTQVTIDINRHKEVIVKAISATILLLLKHFKVNHIYQFEYVSQHLVFANCIPLILKFFNQNVMQYVAARNNCSNVNFPQCVLSPLPPTLGDFGGGVTAANSNGGSSTSGVGGGGGGGGDVLESSTTDPGYCWRNIFSCVNLVRILQKLTKWKHSRTVMLVVFRSAPILKRVLKVRHPLMQLYVLKLLKVQTKYLGRNWRRSNMKAISLIYRRVRHHLHDDWAYGNDLDARPWDFQTEEFALKASIEQFNNRYYYHATDCDGKPLGEDGGAGGGGGGGAAVGPGVVGVGPFGGGELAPLDCNYLSVLGKHVELSDTWKQKYEEWMEVEVFMMPKDWDKLLTSPSAFMEAKAMEL